MKENDPNIIANYFGAPLHEYFSVRHKMDKAGVDSAIKYYREYYSVKGLYENFLYKGIEEMLSELNSNGKTLFLVTVKPTKFAGDILAHFKIDKYFQNIYGSDLTSQNKTKEVLIRNLLENEKIDPAGCVMVGDRSYDIKGAKHNGIRSIAVTYGYGSKEELEEAKPDYIINNTSGLKKLLI